ncbi:membrane protein insertion efficiency factor YidD [Pleionea litopenaei]|uniref:Membrane protein insertion efficiency factor YidD n=1 Tax=Pleionea litopenaei TaxID=3070815 RepID=A0AA51X8K5_9GAMM|nr:membrane protein insertion efficiency factor YidD [Pleionea sp. HL-JVS1]WMS89034.1 membrane protein insertion efficiency factor YidD [Pleionea sp. HL-JVS1]
MKFLVIYFIRIYQKWISPYKGFRCAHAALHGVDSCSTAVIKIINRRGVIGGFGLIRRRFERCKLAYLEHKQEERVNNKKDKKKDKDKCYNNCDPSGMCDIGSCSKAKNCDMDLPCDGSFWWRF